jgi:Do/DeqQ family serine protease
MKNWLSTATVALVSAVAAVGLYRFVEPEPESIVLERSAAESGTSAPTQLVRYLPPSGKAAAGMDFTAAAAVSTPAVVHVKTAVRARATSNRSYHFFRDFFGEDFDPYWNQEQPQSGEGQLRQRGSGSGVIISQDGYIVTNNHVIDDADKIEVILHDKRQLEAKLIGTDPATDLALLKVDYDGLPFVGFGDSDSVLVGEWVLAVGNPFELESTVTAGIVSAKGRNISILERRPGQPAIESFIQTDAAVNPGNSGGALVNTRGELIGINTAIATPTGTFAGYSFAVPVNIVRKVIGDLMDYGIVQRAYLGVMIDVTKEDLGGVFISDIIEGGAAASSELKASDVITDINGFPVRSFPELQEQVSKYQPGDEVEVAFVRDGRARKTRLELRNAQKSTELVSREALAEAAVATVLGATLEALDASSLERFDIEGGVQVADVGEGVLARNTRIGEGFVITGVNDRPVAKPADVEALLERSQGQAILEGFYPAYPYKIYSYNMMLP